MKRSIKTLLSQVVITEDEDGYFLAEVPTMQSCFTQGKTKEEALVNITEVIELWLEHDREIPGPSHANR